MANQEHLGKLQEALKARDIDIWNVWAREQWEKVGFKLNPGFQADFSGADLKGVDLTGADLVNADFTGTDLRGATLLANFKKAVFIETNLERADLRGADLSGAKFRDANLTGANLEAIGPGRFGPGRFGSGPAYTLRYEKKTNLSGADIDNAIIDPKTTKTTTAQLITTIQGVVAMREKKINRTSPLGQTVKLLTGRDPETAVKDAETGGPAQAPKKDTGKGK